MKKDRGNIAFFSLIVALSVIGLMIVQYLLLRRTLSLESDLFSQNVTSVLGSVVQKIENREALLSIRRVILGENGPGGIQRSDTAAVGLLERVTIFAGGVAERGAGGRGASGGSNLETGRLKSGVIRVIMSDSGGALMDTLLKDPLARGRYVMAMEGGKGRGRGSPEFPDSMGIAVFCEGDSAGAGSSFEVTLDDRRIILNKVLDDLSGGGISSVMQIIEPSRLDSLITATMAEKGINTEFEFGIYSASADSFLFAEPPSAAGSLRDSDSRARFFPHDLRVVDEYLVLSFPGKNIYLMKQAAFMALSVFIFLAVIIYSSVSFALLLKRQRRFHGLLVDFINNMTHEFKTPVSTIMIAGEAISAAGGEMTGEKRSRYGRILMEEAGRMRLQIERILQMAAIEKGELRLNLERSDIRGLVRDAAGNHAIRFEAAGGTLSTRFDDHSATAEVDRVHFTNVVNNLIDNAFKYTKGKPRVTVSIVSGDGELTISVEDNGIGMTREQQERIFDMYYRVPTGNVHDVRGFGLGLAYVKMIVEAHGGRVRVESRPGGGSIFSIILPPAGTGGRRPHSSRGAESV
ncbi:MAG: HAMP domain-containing histidine kinase [Candidatus Krumholzibacteria bacterium]|nr:HAMP domain-containing histidine kinase [Candidatus Krumholzibacteria bacterium]